MKYLVSSVWENNYLLIIGILNKKVYVKNMNLIQNCIFYKFFIVNNCCI